MIMSRRTLSTRHDSRAPWSWLLALFVVLTGCSGPTIPPEQVFGDLTGVRQAGVSTADLEGFLSLARGIIFEETHAPVETSSLPGVRVFLTLHEPGRPARVATGKGASLDASVKQAARALQGIKGFTSKARLRLDVTDSAEPDTIAPKQKIPPADLGLFGYLMAEEGGRVGFVLPEEIVYRELYKTGKKARLRRDKVFELAGKRAGVRASEIAEWPLFRFSTIAVVDSEPPGKALPLFRGMVPVTDLPDPARLRDAARAAADYLLHEIDSRGRFTYNYWAAKDKTGPAYNMLRHCGTTYALLEAFETFQDRRYLDAAERALRYAKTKIHVRPGWVKTRPGLGDFVHLIDEEKGELSKTGGAGLALIALTTHAEVTGSRTDLETMRKLAKYILHMQEPNGHFRTYFQYIPNKEVPDKEVLYYPGEAMLGLLQLYQLDSDPRWLEAAEKAADYLIHTRDADKSEADLQHDHWQTMALNELYRLSHNSDYADHAFKIARAIMRKQKTVADAPAQDFVGSFYKLPYTTPASTRLEAYVAAIELARFMGKEDTDLMGAAREVARFVLSQQFNPQNAFFLPDPERAIGGVRESIVNNNIRIDYVQHAISGMLGLASVLQNPDRGKGAAESRAAEGDRGRDAG